MEYYSATKRNKALISVTTWMNLENYAKWKKPVSKGYILYNSIYMKHLDMQIYGDKLD